MPELFDKIGDSLDGAGQQAKAAALALVGDDGDSGARGSLGKASTALAGIVSTIDGGIARVSDAADHAAKVPLMGGVAGSLKEAATDLGQTTGQLGDLAESMAEIATVLAQVGAALAKVGEHLTDTSTQARGFLGTP
mgnify:CR=1 FL=1|nr:hypothetical protein [Dermatophilaceae bacterium]